MVVLVDEEEDENDEDINVENRRECEWYHCEPQNKERKSKETPPDTIFTLATYSSVLNENMADENKSHVVNILAFIQL